jgi:hypothetical protein
VGGDELGWATYEADGLHAGVGEERVAGKLRQAFDTVLNILNRIGTPVLFSSHRNTRA